MNKRLRVVIWSTGGIGKISIKALMARPDTEIVGVWVHSEEKDGRDIGEIVGEAPMGIRATRDVEALIALKPDCVVYAANPPHREVESIPVICRLLAAGLNVVTTSTTSAVYPPGLPQGLRQQVTDACTQGQVSFYASGVEPGFAADYLPLVLATQSSRISKVHAYEIALYSDYPIAFDLMEGMGFGKSLEFEPYLAKPGSVLGAWGGCVQMMADALGWKLERLREVYNRLPLAKSIKTAIGTLEAGTCGAIQMQAIGVIDGRDAIVVEHVNKMAHELAPDWAKADNDLNYRIEISGTPNIRMDMRYSVDDGRAAGTGDMLGSAGGMLATAMRAINAIPYIVSAEPGFYGALDLPLTVPRGAYDGARARIA